MTLYLLPFIAAAIGWFTNYLAVKMLFHPQNVWDFYAFKIQGIFPKRKNILAKNLAATVANELLSAEDIYAILDTNDKDNSIIDVINDSLDDYLENKLPESLNPLMAAFLTQKRIAKIKSGISDQIKDVIHKLKDSYMNKLNSKAIESMIEEKIMEFPNDKLERILMSVMKKELGYIEMIGAIVGFAIGLVQIAIVRFL